MESCAGEKTAAPSFAQRTRVEGWMGLSAAYARACFATAASTWRFRALAAARVVKAAWPPPNAFPAPFASLRPTTLTFTMTRARFAAQPRSAAYAGSRVCASSTARVARLGATCAISAGNAWALARTARKNAALRTSLLSAAHASFAGAAIARPIFCSTSAPTSARANSSLLLVESARCKTLYAPLLHTPLTACRSAPASRCSPPSRSPCSTPAQTRPPPPPRSCTAARRSRR